VAVGQELTANSLIEPFVKLLKDTEQEVRTSAVRAINQMVNSEAITTEQIQL
jgi:hypothetical protein